MPLRIYTVFYLLFYLFFTFSPESLRLSGIWEWVDVAFMSVALTGMCSYAFEFRILTRRFWDYFFYLFIIYELTYMTWLQTPLLEKINMADKATVTNAVNILMMSPVVFSLYRLQQLWSIGTTNQKNPPER